MCDQVEISINPLEPVLDLIAHPRARCLPGINLPPEHAKTASAALELAIFLSYWTKFHFHQHKDSEKKIEENQEYPPPLSSHLQQ